MGRISDRIEHALNLFNKEPELYRGPPPGTTGQGMGSMTSMRPDRRVRVENERSLLQAMLVTIAVDVSDIEFRHAATDDKGRYQETIKSGLQYCFSKAANLDQAARAFRRDMAMTILSEGHAAVVPVDTEGRDPIMSEAYDVKTMRVGVVTHWWPRYVTVRVYNDQPDKGIFEEITLPKRMVAIIENPFGEVMNSPNSIFQRIVRKLAQA